MVLRRSFTSSMLKAAGSKEPPTHCKHATVFLVRGIFDGDEEVEVGVETADVFGSAGLLASEALDLHPLCGGPQEIFDLTVYSQLLPKSERQVKRRAPDSTRVFSRTLRSASRHRGSNNAPAQRCIRVGFRRAGPSPVQD